MADRVVKVKLTADISDYTAGLVKAAALTRGLGNDVEKTVDRDVGPAMTRSGEKSGGLLAQGFRSGFMRRSPLIVAGVTAALAAGAPALLAGASVLFAGVGAIAAAQSVKVREAWTDLGHDIRDDAVADASVLVPVYTEMADKIGASFQRMRPELRDAFEAAAPQIDSFTDSLTQAAENALPGLVRAVERGGPVIDGLGSLMESVGTGLSDMFDAMSDDNADAAGQALAAIGDALQEALPLLGELLGTGSELAAVVLPPLADALGVVADVAAALGPVLPAIVTGFAAFKVADAAAGWLNTFGGSLDNVVARGMAATGTTSKLKGGLAGLAMGIGPLGALFVGGSIALAGYSAMQERAAAQADKLSANLRAGGERAQMTRQSLEAAAASNDVFKSALDDVNAALREQWNAMSPLEQAQSKLAEWTATLAYRMGDESASAEDVAIAQQKVAQYTQQTSDEQGALEAAIDGVTSAMIAQADQAMASIDSGFAYRNSIDQLEDAQVALADAQAHVNDANADTRTSAEDVQRAQLALEEQNYRVATSYGQQQADLSGLSSDSAGYARILQEQTLAKLYELQSAAGPEMAAAIQTQIDALQAGGVKLTGTATTAASTAQKMRDLSLSVTEIPGNKTVFIEAPTADQKRRLEELGYVTRTLPNGQIYVTADTSAAQSAVARFLGQRLSMQVTLNVARGSTTAIGGGLFAATGGGIEGGRLQHFDIGGAVRGAGGPRADRVPAMLSNGEHVWTSREVDAAGGQAAVAAMRRSVLSGREHSGASMGSSGGGADIGRLAAEIAGILSKRPTVGTVVTQRNETGFELAEKLAMRARTGG